MQSTGVIPRSSISTPTSGPTSGGSGGSSPGATTSTSATGSSSHSALGDGAINYIRGLRGIDEICRQAMTMSFETHFQGGQQPIKDWLAHIGWSNSDLKRKGIKEQLHVINAGTDFADMDISLKYSLLLHCCNFSKKPQEWANDPHSEEYSLYALKEKRNKFSHNREELIAELRNPIRLNELFQELQGLLFNALDRLRDYRIDLGQPFADIDRCRLDVVAHLDALKVQPILVEVGNAQRKLRDGKTEEESQMKQLLDIEPFPHIHGLGPFKLQDIYECLDMHIEKRGSHPKDTQKISLVMKNLLTTPLVGSNDIPNVICIEGSSGVGKSTLLSYVVSDRLNTTETITGLKAIDLVLHFNCKEVHHQTLLDLVKSSLPETTKDIIDELLLRAVRNLSVLVLADTFDEVSPDGRILLKHLYQEAKRTKLRVILTTRTGCLDKAESLIGSLKHLRVTLPSMSRAKVGAMARKYYRVLHTRMTDPPEDQVARDVCTAAKHLASTSRNVLLLTYLAIVEPEKVKVPLTLPELLDTMDEISLKMLRERLEEKGLSPSEIESDIRTFIQDFNAAALEILLNRATDSTMDHLNEIARKCKYPTDMMDTFLSCRRERTVTGDQASYAFPHESQLEYRAALGVCDKLKRSEETGQSSCDTDLHHILRLMSREKGERKELLDHLWNFLLFLVGALWLHKLLPRHAEEMAELMVSFRKGKADEALEAIGQAKMDKAFTEAVVSRLDSEWVVTKHLHVLNNLQELPQRVCIELWSCCNEVPHLAEAIANLRRRKDKRVGLQLYGCTLDPCFQGCCEWAIQKLTAPGVLCSVEKLYGPWTSGALLQTSVTELNLVIPSLHHLEALQAQVNNIPSLLWLRLHVCATKGYKPQGLPMEKWVSELHLHYVANHRWRWTTDLLASLHGHKNYGDIILYTDDLTTSSFRFLVDEWVRAGVKISSITVSTCSWQARDSDDMASLVRQKLMADFRLDLLPLRQKKKRTTRVNQPLEIEDILSAETFDFRLPLPPRTEQTGTTVVENPPTMQDISTVCSRMELLLPPRLEKKRTTRVNQPLETEDILSAGTLDFELPLPRRLEKKRTTRVNQPLETEDILSAETLDFELPLPPRTEQTGTTVVKNPPTMQGIRAVPSRMEPQRPSGMKKLGIRSLRILTRHAHDPTFSYREVVNFPMNLKVPYTLAMMLRATKKIPEFSVTYKALGDFDSFKAKFMFNDKKVHLRSSNPSTRGDGPDIVVPIGDSWLGDNYVLEIEERKNCYVVKLDSMVLDVCPKHGHSEDVTLCHHIRLGGFSEMEVLCTIVLEVTDEDNPTPTG